MTPASLGKKTYLALLHYPVYDKHRRVVTTSITNLDIHDIARSSRTYGLAGYILVHPVAAQRELARRILGHWHDCGEQQNDFRREALSLVRVLPSLEEAVEQISQAHGAPPLVVSTSAQRARPATTSAALLQDPELEQRPMLLLFGTGWGLTAPLVDRSDRLLEPICGPTDYNHLSVRSAAGIILDRIFGEHNRGAAALRDR